MTHPDSSCILVLDSKPTEVVRFAWPGGYPVFYFAADQGVLCPDCVQANLLRCCDPDDEQYCVIMHAVNWEDPCLTCDDCSERIESAYAEDEVA